MLDKAILTPLFIIGRIIVGGFYLMNAINHLTKADMLTQYAESKGVPSSKLAVIGTGFLLLLTSLSIFTGAFVTYGAIAAIVFFLGVTPVMHNFWSIEDPQQKMGEMVNFMKNMALMGYTLLLLSFSDDWVLSLPYN